MHRVIIVINVLLCLSSTFIYSQDKNYEEAAYKLLNEVYFKKVHNSYLNKKVLTVDWDKYLVIEWLNNNNSGLDKFFEPIHLELKEEDLEFMKKQASDNNINQWRKRHIKNIKLIRDNKKIDYSKYSKYKISQPVFSDDKSYSIIIEECIRGMENASSILRIFMRDGNMWKEVAFVQLWIS